METPPSTQLRRRISIATPTPVITTTDIPFAIESSSTPSSSFDFDLISIKRPSSFVAYTSLRDIISSPSNSSSSSVKLPSSINGCSSPVVSTVGDISIRDPLVKRAAWSYLQATATASSEDSPGCHQFLRGVWIQLSAGVQFLRRVFGWILQSICAPRIVK